MGTLSVALVNDYPVVVRGLDAMLQPYAHRIRVAGLGVQRPPDRQVDVTLYDSFAAAGPDQDVDRLLGDPQAGRVLLYSWNVRPSDVEAALARGCAGYVDKAATAAELVSAIERTAAGGLPVVPAPALHLTVEHPARGWPGQEAGLSAREAEVLALIAQGLTNLEVGRRLNLSVNTVKTYVRSAYLKIGVARRSQAVKWGIENGMLPGRPEAT